MTATTVTGIWNAQKKCVEVHPIFWEDVAIKDGTEVTAVISADRNPDQLRAYWATLGNIISGGYWNGDKDSLDDYTRQGIGFGKWRAIASGGLDEAAFQAAWKEWSAVAGDTPESAFRKAVEAYEAAIPGRVIFVPDSIALSRCDGTKFQRFMFFAERLWAEKLGVDIEALRREVATHLQRRAA